jgi:hypothetical protein
MVALGQAKIAHNRQVAVALTSLANQYFKEAETLGWRPREIRKEGPTTD